MRILIQYKLLFLTYKTLTTGQPTYRYNLISVQPRSVLVPHLSSLLLTRLRSPPLKSQTPLSDIKVKVRTLDIAPLRSESPPQKRSGMARVLKGFHSFYLHTHTFIRNRNEPYLPLPSQP